MIDALQVTFHDMEPYQQAEAWVREEADKLDEFFPKITGCRVTIEVPHRRRQWGNPYQVRVDLTVPGKELAVAHEPNLHQAAQTLGVRKRTKSLETQSRYKDLHAAIHDAFKTAKRQLRDYVRQRRREVKTHDTPPRGRVTQLFPEKNYGFLVTVDGREIYFHRDSVLTRGFDRLEVGSEVNFTEEQGEKGPQASTVKITRRHASPYPEKKSLRRVRPFR